MIDLLARIEAFRPAVTDDNWRELDGHVQALFEAGGDLSPAIGCLLRVFERFPRHDGHGVLWTILHGIERIPGYEPQLIEHVRRAPTELGITMLQRLARPDLASLIAELAPKAPVIDYFVAPAQSPGLLAELDALVPGDVDWDAARALVRRVFALPAIAPAVTPLLRVLDRFHTVDHFALYWPIIDGLEARDDYPAALLASLKASPTRNGLTLLLRLHGLRELTTIDGVDVAAFAAELIAAST